MLPSGLLVRQSMILYVDTPQPGTCKCSVNSHGQMDQNWPTFFAVGLLSLGFCPCLCPRRYRAFAPDA